MLSNCTLLAMRFGNVKLALVSIQFPPVSVLLRRKVSLLRWVKTVCLLVPVTLVLIYRLFIMELLRLSIIMLQLLAPVRNFTLYRYLFPTLSGTSGCLHSDRLEGVFLIRTLPLSTNDINIDTVVPANLAPPVRLV